MGRAPRVGLLFAAVVCVGVLLQGCRGASGGSSSGATAPTAQARYSVPTEALTGQWNPTNIANRIVRFGGKPGSGTFVEYDRDSPEQPWYSGPCEMDREGYLKIWNVAKSRTDYVRFRYYDGEWAVIDYFYGPERPTGAPTTYSLMGRHVPDNMARRPFESPDYDGWLKDGTIQASKNLVSGLH